MGAGKVSYSDLSIAPTPGAARDNSHKETIEIQSWSLGASNPTSAAGQTNVNAGVLNFTAATVPASVGRLCASHATLPTMTIESDGQRREFRNVAFKDCPAGAAGGTFTLTFNGQTTGAATASLAGPANLEIPNVTIEGFTRMKCQNNLKQLALGVQTATIYVGTANGGVWKTTDGGTPAPGTKFPSVDIISKGGTRVSFLKVELKDVMVTSWQTSAAGGAPSQVQKITIAYESTNATQSMVDAMIAGR
jgi:type VI protein secretion system component Hcp